MKILLLSTIYPLPSKDNKGTAVCHFFTREWVKMGYDVKAVHVQAVYPHFFYWIARIARKRIASRTGAVVYTKRLSQIEKYHMDGVPVMRVPVYKPIPHGAFSSKSVSRAVDEVWNLCREDSFTPDVIIGHFPNPQIEMVSMLKKRYPSAKGCIVMHGDTDIMIKVYGSCLFDLLKSIDIWGFRCKQMISEFEEKVCKIDNPFVCYSGIPEKYITHKNTHVFNKPLNKFLYVGEMIERKYPEKILDALVEVYPSKDFEASYIGDGQQVREVKAKIDNYDVSSQVLLLGWIPRDKIIEEYDKADCLIMISRGEAYGLVYLEAMARGCITIASRNEGFDGIIVDGENGFLCEAGSTEDLANIIRKINSLTQKERQRISDNAIITARALTDEKAAEMYINDIKKRM